MEHTNKIPKVDIPEEVFKEALTNNISEIQKKISPEQHAYFNFKKQLEFIESEYSHKEALMNKKYKDSIILIIVFSCLWIGTTTFIQAIINPKMTQTELFLNIPNSVILNFDRT